MHPVRTAFAMEQALGHVTHYQNLRQFAERQHDIAPIWLPIPFDVRGPAQVMPFLRNNWSVRASWRARRELDRTLSRTSLDAVVFHTQVTSLFSIPIMRRLPGVISLDATPINYDSVGQHYGHRPAGDGLLDRQKFRLSRSAFHAAVGLVTWSEWARRSLIQDYGVDAARVRVLAPGAAPAYFDIGRARDSAVARRPASRVRLLFVGADFRRKGGPLLLDALRGRLGDDCELHVVTRSEVPAQPNVVVHRDLHANSPALLDLFAQADVFVLPSHADCLAVVLMEATAAGLPVITTDIAALPEAVEPGESGLLVPSGNGFALQQALTSLVYDADRRQRMGRAGFALASRKFNAQHNNRALLDLVGELVANQVASRRAA